ncbi:MAG: type 1 glutamine amidotransferase [Solirubrobacteraceae bacterium]
MQPLLVLQHIGCEPPAAYEDELLERSLSLRRVQLDEGERLLAASLGADVAPGPLPEVGVLPVQLTGEAAADPVFSVAPASFDALHWHGDTYELPRGAVHLARSERYAQQAFVFANAYALQFHLEVTPALVAEWGTVPAYADGLQRLPGVTLPGLLQQVAGVERAAVALARELFARWLVHVVGVPAAADA